MKSNCKESNNSGRTIFFVFMFWLVALIPCIAFAQSETIQYEYDNARQLIKVTYGDGTVVDYVYDNSGNCLLMTTTLGGSPPNNPPDAVNNPIIPDGATDISIQTILSWEGVLDPDSGDEVVYYVYFGPAGDLSLMSSGRETTFDPGLLSSLTEYCWQVVSKDNHNTVTEGPVWCFTTINVPPVAEFSADVTAGMFPLTVEFTDMSTSSDGDDITWEWDFDNNGEVDSTEQNPVYTYSQPGIYTVSLTVTDIRDAAAASTETKNDYIEVWDDVDGDSIADPLDNCPDVSNPSQADMDSDGIGDVCDSDLDGDGINNQIDNCPNFSNSSQADMDEDGIGDHCDDEDGDNISDHLDNCPYDSNPSQADMDSDGIGDVCDPDADGDEICNPGETDPLCSGSDNCPYGYNPGQADDDGDGIGDFCDNDSINYGLVAYYPFNSNANDESEFGNHGTVYGSTLATDMNGVPDRAYSFDGINDYINVPDSSSLDLTTAFTLIAWIKLDDNNDGETLFSKSYGTYEPYRISFHPNITEAVIASSASNRDFFQFTPVPLDEWIHVAVTYDAGLLESYYDGVLIDSETLPITQLYTTDRDLILGARKHSSFSEAWFEGIMDEVRIHNRALSGSKVLELYELRTTFNSDSDSIPDYMDNCPVVPNEDQMNSDEDSLGNVCDNCPDTSNPDQADYNYNGTGDACETQPNLLVNPSFESGLDSWTTDHAHATTSSSLDPHHGSSFLHGGDSVANSETYQEVDLLDAGYSAQELDSNTAVAFFGGWQTSYQTDTDRGKIEVILLDADLNELGSRELNWFYSYFTWTLHQGFIAILPGTRYVSFVFYAERHEGSNNDAYLDSVFLYIGDPTILPDDSDSDGIYDEIDNCPATYNRDQADYNCDGSGDACDLNPNLLDNPGFESSLDGWTTDHAHATTFSINPGPYCGSSFLHGGIDGSANSETYQDVDLLDAGYSAQELDSNTAVAFFGGWQTSYQAQTDSGKIEVILLDADLNELGSRELNWFYSYFTWTLHQGFIDILPGTRYIRFVFYAERHNGSNNDAYLDSAFLYITILPDDSDSDGIYDEFDNCPATYNPDQTDYNCDGTGDACDLYPNLLDNSGFENGLDGWNTDFAITHTANPDPHCGSSFLHGGNGVANSETYQDVDLLDAGYSAQELDSGFAVAFFGGWQTSYKTDTDRGKIEVILLDADLNELDSRELNWFYSFYVWTLHQGSITILPGTRYIRFVFHAERHNGSNNNAYLDSTFLFVSSLDFDSDGINDDEDNCPDVYNPDQRDIDGDGIGDVCDNSDTDNDGVTDYDDNCPTTPNGPTRGTCSAGTIGKVCTSHGNCGCGGYCSMDQEDADGDGTGDVCD